jgi:hypothetical protein
MSIGKLILTVLLIAPAGAFADDPAAASAAAASAPAAEARIAFSDRSIWSWQVIDNKTLLIETNSRKWYKASLFSSCTDLPFAERVGFKANSDGSFDRFSALVVRGQHCALTSLVETTAPAKKSKKKPIDTSEAGKP